MNHIAAMRIPGSEENGAYAPEAAPRAAQRISVEIACAGRLADIRADWTDLLRRTAEPNVFMDPALIAAAHDADPNGGHRALLAWTGADGSKRLVGLWAFSVGRPRRSMLPLPVMRAPAFSHSYLATPVIDRDCLDETFDAMLDGVAESHVLPKIMSLDTMGSSGPTYEALVRVLEARGSSPCVFEQVQRPKLASELDGKAYLEKALSSSTRKKLRQHRRKLSEKGALTSSVANTPEDVRKAVEEFLAIEAAGWKGRQGTAIASDAAESAFMRSAINPSRRQAGEHAARRARRHHGVHVEDRLRRSVPRLLAGHAAARGLHGGLPCRRIHFVRRLLLVRRHRLHVGLAGASVRR
jgi:CelD/BcsL family acetyltransferase involved in cellulose biosynthesis